jgi:hypothetical protein
MVTYYYYRTELCLRSEWLLNTSDIPFVLRIRVFINTFTKAYHRNQSGESEILSTTSHTISLTAVLILLPTNTVFPTKFPPSCQPTHVRFADMWFTPSDCVITNYNISYINQLTRNLISYSKSITGSRKYRRLALHFSCIHRHPYFTEWIVSWAGYMG